MPTTNTTGTTQTTSSQQNRRQPPPFAAGAGRSGRFWAWSIGAHVVLLLVVFLTPAREIFLENDKPKKPKIMISGEKLSEMIDDIRDAQARKLRARLMVLGSATDRMQVNLLNKQGRHQGFESAQKLGVFRRMQTGMQEAITNLEAKQALHAQFEKKSPSKDHADSQQKRDVLVRQIQEDIVAALPLLPRGEDFPGADSMSALQRKAAATQGRCQRFPTLVCWL